MTFVQKAIQIGESAPCPDFVVLAGIAWLVGRTRRELCAQGQAANHAFAQGMSAFPIAVNTRDANEQHYEIPAEFFDLILGPQRKYSCCLYDNDASTLAEAEERALSVTAENAYLTDGQRILELGCGWGSLSLWMARRFPNARITSVSNSNSQCAFIVERARRAGISNLDVITADMNEFSPSGHFDRVLSVEMFEHMANWRPLLQRIRSWLDHDGRLFLHVFSHKSAPYRFLADDREDWIARHFFTGGIMPSHALIGEFSDIFTLEADWRWSGTHYQRTAQDWLANYDKNSDAIFDVLRRVYAGDAKIWQRRWRLFFLATMGLFGHRGGEEWGVSHYRLKAAA